MANIDGLKELEELIANASDDGVVVVYYDTIADKVFGEYFEDASKAHINYDERTPWLFKVKGNDFDVSKEVEDAVKGARDMMEYSRLY